MSFIGRLIHGKDRRYDYHGAGFATKGKNLGFMDDPKFIDAYNWSIFYEYGGLSSVWKVRDLRWRVHTCIWAAKQAMHIDGDFVECGVDTAMWSGAVVRYLNFQDIKREFFLFDTYEGIPEVEGMTESEQHIRSKNGLKYFELIGPCERQDEILPKRTHREGGITWHTGRNTWPKNLLPFRGSQ